ETDPPAHQVILLHGLSCRVERHARFPNERSRSVRGEVVNLLLLLGDRWERDNGPIVLGQNVADQVVLVESLHHNDDAACAFVVEPREQGVVVPVVDRPSAASESASSGFNGSSMMITSAPRPVRTPPTEVAMRVPPKVVDKRASREKAKRMSDQPRQ